MNLGTENRNKTIAALVVGALAVIMVVYRIFNPAGSPPQAADVTAPNVSSAPATAGRPSPRRTQTARPTTSGKKPLATSLDPTLQLVLLRSSEDIRYTGNGRNIFQAQIDIPKPVVSAVVPPKPEPPPPPLPPPPIPLKFFGFASKPGEAKKIFLSQGEDVFIAGEGEIVNRRYRVVHISPASVEIEDVLNNNRQSIPLTQG